MDKENLHEDIKRAVSLREGGDPEGAGSLLFRFLENHPEDAEAHYQMAWACDVRGMEREAIPHYKHALEGGLSEGRSGVYIGLGSSLRSLGEYGEAVETLRRGASEFPEDRAIRAFLAMALYNVGEHREAMEILLRDLAETSSDEGVAAYKEAIRFYSARLDGVWE